MLIRFLERDILGLYNPKLIQKINTALVTFYNQRNRSKEHQARYKDLNSRCMFEWA